VKSAAHQSRSPKLSTFSGQKEGKTIASITQASVHPEGSIPTELVTTKKVLGTRSGKQPSVCSSIGFDAGLTSVSKLKERWTRHFVDAASFSHSLRGDDLSFLIEALQKNFPHLNRIQDLEAYTSYKQITRSGAGSQKLILLLCIIYLSYTMPTSVTLGHSSDTFYLFSYSHTPVSENFPSMCSKKDNI